MKRLLERVLREPGFAWYGFCQFFFILFFVLFFRYRVFGLRNLPPTGGVLVASNHQSFLDPPLVGLFMGRQMNLLARRSLFKNPVFARIIRSWGAIPLDRGRGDRAALEKGIEILKSGRLLIVFPEGTRSADGSIGPLKAGIFLMARRAKAPIVPAVIDGAFEAWPRDRKLFQAFRGIRVAFGRPILPARGADVAGLVREEMGRLQERLRRVRN